MELQGITGTISPIREGLPGSETATATSESVAQPAQPVPREADFVLSDALQSTAGKNGSEYSTELTAEEKKAVAELKARDVEVRQHERAHMSAGGTAAGGVSYEYVTGPDGQRYATSGEVTIDTSAVKGDPEATIRKAQQIRRAALAPAQPSSQDRRVAAIAMRMEMEARIEISQQRAEESRQQANYNTIGIQPPAPPQDQIFNQYA